MKLLKNKKGFTLVELLVVIIIIGILITVVYQIFSSTQSYNRAVEMENEQQSLATEVMYRLRVELADAAEVEAFDPVSEPEKMDFSDSANDGYYYIVQNTRDDDSDGVPDGGILLYGYDDAGNRSTAPTVYGNRSTKVDNYYCAVLFTITSSNGNGKIDVRITNPEIESDPDPSRERIYSLSSDMKMRSVGVNNTSVDPLPAIRYKYVS